MGSKKALCWQNTRYWTWKGEKRFLRKFTKKSYSHCLKITENVSFEFSETCHLTIFGIFNELLATYNVNVARFARNIEWDFFCDFQTPWCSTLLQTLLAKYRLLLTNHFSGCVESINYGVFLIFHRLIRTWKLLYYKTAKRREEYTKMMYEYFCGGLESS